jgi:hypothetical protein
MKYEPGYRKGLKMRLNTSAALILVSLLVSAAPCFSSDVVEFRVASAYSITGPNSAMLASSDGSQTGTVGCEKKGKNELVFYGDVEDRFLLSNFRFASHEDCLALVALVYQKDGLESGRTLTIQLNTAKRVVESASY